VSRPVLRRLLVLAALAAVAAVALALGFFPQEPVRRRVEARLQAALGPGARLGRLRIVPGRLAADARDVVLEGDGYRLEVPRVSLALDRSILLGGPLSLARLEVYAPRLAVKPTAAKPAAPAGPQRLITVRELRIEDGALSYTDPAMGALTLSGVSARGSLGVGTLEVDARGGMLELERGRSVPIRSLRARLESLPRIKGDLHVLAGDSRLTASGSVGTIARLDPDLTVELDVHLADVAALTGTPVDGTLEIDGRIRGAASVLAVDAKLASDGLSLAGWPLTGLRGQLTHAAGDRRTKLSLRAGFLGGRLSIEGSAAGRAGRLASTLDGGDLDVLRRTLGLEGPLPGVLGGTLVAEGDLASSIRLEGRLAADHPGPGVALSVDAQAGGVFRVRDESLDVSWTASAGGTGAAAARVRSLALTAVGTARGRLPPSVQGELDGTLQLAGEAGPAHVTLRGQLGSQGDVSQLDLRAQGLGGSASSVARLRGSRVESLELLAESLDLAALLPAAKGRAGMRVDASGPIGRLSLSGRADVSDLEWRAARIGSVNAGVEGTLPRLRWTIAVPDLAIAGSGELVAAGATRLSGSLVSTGLPLAPLAPLVSEGLEGSVVGQAEFDVPLAASAEMDVRARVDSLDIRRDAWSVSTARSFTVNMRGTRLDVGGLRLDGHGGFLEASGRLGLRPFDPIDLRLAADLDLARLPAPEGWTLGGRTTADVRIRGTRKAPEARGQVAARAVSAEGPRLPPLVVETASVELAGREARLDDAVVTLAGGQVTASGRFPLALASGDGRVAAGDAATARISWSGVDAGTLLERFRPGQAGTVEAALAGAVDLEATGVSLATLRARLEVPETSLVVHQVPATLAPFTMQLRQGRLATEALALDTPGGRLNAAGTIDLEKRRLDVTAQGALELRALSPWIEVASLSGTAEIDLAANGPFDAPSPRGHVRVRDASVRMREIPQALTELAATLAFDAGSLRIEDGSAGFGGGSVALVGQARLAGMELSDVDFKLTGREMALRYPVGLRSRVEADLRLTGRSGALLLAGAVKASRGVYDLDIGLQDSFRAAPRQPAESALLRSLALELAIETLQPVRVKNNLADLEAGGTLRLRGDLQEPAPFGRLELQPGGKVFLQERSFAIESGRLEYAGSWDPNLNVSARAQIRGSDDLGRSNEYAVDIVVQGTLEKPALRFSSQPALSETEIVSLIATGRTRDTALRAGGWVAGEQAAILLSGRLTRGVSQQLRRLGFDEVTIQPELLARETDPGARFTFGKQIGARLGLLYSLSLNNPEDRFVQLEARPGLSTTALVQRLDDGTWTYGGGQRFEWGGSPRPKPPKEERTLLADVRLLSDEALPEEQLRQDVGLRTGDKVTSWQLQDKADKLRDRLRDRGHLEAEVGARLEANIAVLRIRAGARYEWRVEGMSNPPDLGSEIQKALFEEEAVELGTNRLLATLHARGRLRAEVETRVLEEGHTRVLLFAVRPGPVLRADVQFPGANEIPQARLLVVSGGATELLDAPEEARRRIREAYAEHLHLAADVGEPQAAEQQGTLVVRVPVDEGPRARLAGVVFEDAPLPAEPLAALSGLGIGDPYDPERVAQAALRVRDHFLGLGHPSVRVRADTRREGPDLVAVFHVAAGPKVTVAGVEIAGAPHTRASLVRRQVTLKPGDPLDPRKLAEVERRLLELGIFSRATIVPSDENPSTLRVELQERAQLNAGYDFRYNDDDKSTVQLDGELVNLVGRGLALGGRLKVGRDVRQGRGSLGLPALPGVGDLVGSVFQTEEDFLAVDPFTLEPVDATRVERGFQLQLAKRLPDRWTLLYGYRFKRSSVRPIFGIPTDIAALETSLLRDTRDSPLDARRGRFWSLSVEYSPSLLGSDLTFVKGLGQLFVARSIRPSWVWAQGYRLGLAHGFGDQTLIFSERFLAGGANTVRGYGAESLGPLDVFDEPAGGQAVLVLNQELRYHHRSGLGLAGFWDAGEVFDTVSDLGLDLRHALGLGLRWESPVGLLRLDVGFPLNREPRDKSYRLFLGLGQAF
jgi:translocation and assembly module TamA